MRFSRRAFAREARTYRDCLVALIISALTGVLAGITLASTSQNLEELPGLLLLVPATLAVKGNIFGAMGSRLSTAIHAGSVSFRWRLNSVVGQNTAASILLSLVVAVLIAVLAKGMAIVFAISPTMSLGDFIAVSTIAGLLASVFMLFVTLLLADRSTRFGWDLDNVVGPLSSAASDLVSLPALLLAAQLAGIANVTPILAGLVSALALAAAIWGLITRLSILKLIVRESIPVLAIAAIFDLIAGITIEARLDQLVRYPVLLVLLPGFLGAAGGLGGVLSSRLSTKVHLGLLSIRSFPTASSVADIALIFALSIPIFAATGGLALVAGVLTNQASPGAFQIVAVALLGGLMATICVVIVAYYSTVVAVRFGLDPDTHGIPMVTASLDFLGAFVLILAIFALGVT